MRKGFRRRDVSVPPRVESDIITAINKIQEQLVYLEKKIDTLINKSAERPFEGRNFPKPFPRPEENRHHDRGRNFTKVICADCGRECEVPFRPSPGRPVYCQECFAKRKREGAFKTGPDNRPRQENLSPRAALERQESKESQGAGGKKKPVSRKRKKRV